MKFDSKTAFVLLVTFALGLCLGIGLTFSRAAEAQQPSKPSQTDEAVAMNFLPYGGGAWVVLFKSGQVAVYAGDVPTYEMRTRGNDQIPRAVMMPTSRPTSAPGERS